VSGFGVRGATGRKVSRDTSHRCLACDRPAPKHSYCEMCRDRLRRGWECLEFTEYQTLNRHEMRRAQSAGTATAWAPFLPWETSR